MLLNSIELENIRSYEKEKIEFPRGITLFEGDIGSGKSTVLMGIEFALFGLGSQKPESLLAKKANEGAVTLNFEVNDKKCEVKRVLKRKSDSVSQDPKHSYLKINEVMEPLSPSELKQRILQILNFNESEDPRSESRIFRYAVFTPQEEMKEVLRDDSRRLETIRKAFRVEEYKTAVENSENFRKYLDMQSEIFKDRFRDISRYEAELQNSKDTISETIHEINKLEEEKNQIEQQNVRIKSELSENRKKSEKLASITSEIENTQKQLTSKEKDADRISRNIADGIKDADELDEKLKSFKNIAKPTSKSIDEINDLIKTLSDTEKEITSLDSKFGTILEQSRKLEKELGEYAKRDRVNLTSHLEESTKKTKLLQQEYEELEKMIKEKSKIKNGYETNFDECEKGIIQIQELGSKCPVCESQLSIERRDKLEKERKTRLEELKIKLEVVSSDISSYESRYQRLKEEILKLEGDKTEIKTVLPRLLKLEQDSDEMNDIQIRLKELKGRTIKVEEKSFDSIAKYETPLKYLLSLKDALLEYQNACEKIETVENQIKKILQAKEDNLKELETKRQEMNELKDRIQKLNLEIDSFKGLKEAIKTLENDEIVYQDRLRETSVNIARHVQIKTTHDEKIRDTSEKILEAQNWQKWHRKYSNYHYWTKNFFIPTLEQIEKQVLLAIQQEFNETYRHWYSILIDDPTKESRIDENFTPIVEQDGYEQDTGFLSGGEKTSIALAYRLTLNSLIRKESGSMNTNLLILDEPTDGFSKTQLAKVKSLLLELDSEQIILVSHEKELETYVDNIFHISKDSGISKVSRLSK